MEQGSRAICGRERWCAQAADEAHNGSALRRQGAGRRVAESSGGLSGLGRGRSAVRSFLSAGVPQQEAA
jgi:hypothetical protein